jgi:hypothetical protein
MPPRKMRRSSMTPYFSLKANLLRVPRGVSIMTLMPKAHSRLRHTTPGYD